MVMQIEKEKKKRIRHDTMKWMQIEMDKRKGETSQ